jgi:multidrug resistance efflux pump
VTACEKGKYWRLLNTTEIAAQMAQAEENLLKAKRDAQRTQNLYRDSVSYQRTIGKQRRLHSKR